MVGIISWGKEWFMTRSYTTNHCNVISGYDVILQVIHDNYFKFLQNSIFFWYLMEFTVQMAGKLNQFEFIIYLMEDIPTTS